MLRKLLLTGGCLLALSACTAGTNPSKNMDVMEGPPVTNIHTPYDDVLSCAYDKLKGHDLAWVGVGDIKDATGKFANGDGGNGFYVTQAAGDIAQNAWFEIQPDNVVNRRDFSVMLLENSLGRVLKIKTSDYHVTGSINTLDFLPGGGFDVTVAGVGAKARQYRMIVGMDLTLTDTNTSEIVAQTSLNKQIVALDYGMGIGRFFGDTLVTLDIGEQQREAVGIATRAVLQQASFNLASQLYDDVDMSECNAILDNVENVK